MCNLSMNLEKDLKGSLLKLHIGMNCQSEECTSNFKILRTFIFNLKITIIFKTICKFIIQAINLFECSFRLDDDKWHSILVERNRKEAMVVVDGARKGQVKEPRGPVRPMLLNKPLYIGS